MNHLTQHQLQEYIDGQQPQQIELHLRSCFNCQKRIDDLRHLERAMKRLPLEDVSVDFTQRVMTQLGVKESLSFGWSIFKNLAPMVALTLVVGGLIVVLKLSGVFAGSNIGETVGQTQSLLTSASGKVSSGMTTFNTWLQTILPFAFAKQSYGFTSFLLLFLGFIGVLDKFVIAPMFRKRM